jgi:hypothetical protein
MIEALFIIGLIGTLMAFVGESLAALESFPAICAGCILVPLLSWTDHVRLERRYDLEGTRRSPLPPARFYWSFRGPRLRLRTIGLIPISVVAWIMAIAFPASMHFDRTSVIGWTATIVGILASARMIAGTLVYFRGAQWMDPMSPAIVGGYRRMMFWLSEDAEFLGRGQLKRPNEKERAIY